MDSNIKNIDDNVKDILKQVPKDKKKLVKACLSMVMLRSARYTATRVADLFKMKDVGEDELMKYIQRGLKNEEV